MITIEQLKGIGNKINTDDIYKIINKKQLKRKTKGDLHFNENEKLKIWDKIKLIKNPETFNEYSLTFSNSKTITELYVFLREYKLFEFSNLLIDKGVDLSEQILIDYYEKNLEENNGIFYEVTEILMNDDIILKKKDIKKLKKLVNDLHPMSELGDNLTEYFDILSMSYIFKLFVENKLFDLSDVVLKKGITWDEFTISMLFYLSFKNNDMDMVNYLIESGFKYSILNIFEYHDDYKKVYNDSISYINERKNS